MPAVKEEKKKVSAKNVKEEKKVSAKNVKEVKEKKERVAGPRSVGEDPLAVRQTNLLKAMKKLKATDPTAAKHASVLGEAIGYNAHDVYSMCYTGGKLANEGLVANAKVDGVRGVCHYITEAGLESIAK